MRFLVRSAVIAIVPLIGLAPAAGQEKKETPPLRVTCTRDSAVYKVDEEAVFRVESDVDAIITYTFSNDGRGNLKSGKTRIEKGKPLDLTGKLEQPGFLQLRIDAGKQRTALAAAAFDPTKIEPTARPPADFEEFWETARKDLAKVPVDAKLEYSKKHSDNTVDCWKVSLASIGGRRVHGWVSVPKGKGPFPAILTVPYAGVYGIDPDKSQARLGAISMNIIVHDIPVDEKPEFYRTQEEGPLNDYRNIGMYDAQKNYFRGAILSCLRAADYVTSRPDYNGKDFAVTGSSQGGGLALILAGLDPRVKVVAANVPALCDHTGLANGRSGGWPQWLNRAKADSRYLVMNTVPYFDAVNFARKFKGQSLVGVGYLDTACPPTTVYSVYNVLPEPKALIASPQMGHGTDPRWGPARIELWKKTLALKPPDGK